jgi:nuclear pore complex protein Nup88
MYHFCCCVDHFTGVELDALYSSIDAVAARLRRHTQSSKDNVSNRQRQISGKKDLAHDAHISQLKSSLEKISLVNSENSKKLKIVESELKNRESSRF